jgi:hypothetical protein
MNIEFSGAAVSTLDHISQRIHRVLYQTASEIAENNDGSPVTASHVLQALDKAIEFMQELQGSPDTDSDVNVVTKTQLVLKRSGEWSRKDEVASVSQSDRLEQPVGR